LIAAIDAVALVNLFAQTFYEVNFLAYLDTDFKFYTHALVVVKVSTNVLILVNFSTVTLLGTTTWIVAVLVVNLHTFVSSETLKCLLVDVHPNYLKLVEKVVNVSNEKGSVQTTSTDLSVSLILFTVVKHEPIVS